MATGPGGSDLNAVSSLSDPLRARLYEVITSRPEPVRRDEAAAAAGIGQSLAAYHLDKMVELGLLDASYQRSPGQRTGRPAKVYTRSGREFTVTMPTRAYELAARLMTQAIASGPPGDGRLALQETARAYGTEAGRSRKAGGAPGSSGRESLEAVLGEYGYEPACDADGTLRLRNCPFHHLSARHPDIVCAMNLALVEGLAAGLDAGTTAPVRDPQPGHCCVAIPVGELANLPPQPRRRRLGRLLPRTAGRRRKHEHNEEADATGSRPPA